MKNIKVGTVKCMIIEIIAVSLFGIILYPLFDLILCNFITNSEFKYSVYSHIVQPVLFGCIFGVVSFLFYRNKNK